MYLLVATSAREAASWCSKRWRGQSTCQSLAQLADDFQERLPQGGGREMISAKDDGHVANYGA